MSVVVEACKTAAEKAYYTMPDVSDMPLYVSESEDKTSIVFEWRWRNPKGEIHRGHQTVHALIGMLAGEGPVEITTQQLVAISAQTAIALSSQARLSKIMWHHAQLEGETSGSAT